ncbi:MAG: cbb3-type cytochrome c oxidase subunit 3 [Alphaproteobacteria bacterium]|nr:cbb3-type cytochrome c oxidase subunit 3 [Alphaproteobacteria bacterium]
MNHITRAIAESASAGWLVGLSTAIFIGFFLAWTWYAYRPANRQAMEDAARIPFEDGDER